MPKANEDAHHVIRYVRKNLLRRDENGNILGLLPQALELREHEDALSISWLEPVPEKCGRFSDKNRLRLKEPVPEKCGRFSDKNRLKLKGIEHFR